MSVSLKIPVMAAEALLRLAGNRRYRQRPREWSASLGPGGVEEARRRCAEASRDLLAFIRPEPKETPPDAVITPIHATRFPGRVFQIAFASPRPTGDEINDRVHARLLLPPSGAPGDRVVVFHHAIRHDHWTLWEWFVEPLARRVPVAIMAGPHHFERRRPGTLAGQALCNANPWRLYEGLRQWCADQHALEHLLRERLGLRTAAVAGFSLGAFQTLCAASAGCIPRVPLVSIASTCWYPWGLTRGWLGAPGLEALRGVGIDEELLFEMTGALDLARYAHRLRDRPVLYVTGRWDRVDPPPSPQRLRRALEPARALTLDAGHGTLLWRRRAILREMLAFFAEVDVLSAARDGSKVTSPAAAS